MDRTFGILSQLNWKKYKEEKDIKFVKEAEKAIEKLQKTIDEIKYGNRKVTEFTTLISVIYE